MNPEPPHSGWIGLRDVEAPVVTPTDAERARLESVLRGAVGQGLLTLPEFEQRLDAVYNARSMQELEALARWLQPAEIWSGASRRRWRPRLAMLLGGVAVLAGVVVVGSAGHHNGQRPAAATVAAAREDSRQVPPGVSASVKLKAHCIAKVPLSEMQTAWLNQDFQLGLPGRSQTAECRRLAGFSAAAVDGQDAFHVHLDLTISGGMVIIPKGLGIDPATGKRAPIYSDNDQGIVTVSRGGAFTLGQLFLQWGHPLGADSIGTLRQLPGRAVYWFVNGKAVTDPADLLLTPHQEIMGFGDMRGANINPTASYDFPPGY